MNSDESDQIRFAGRLVVPSRSSIEYSIEDAHTPWEHAHEISGVLARLGPGVWIALGLPDAIRSSNPWLGVVE